MSWYVKRTKLRPPVPGVTNPVAVGWVGPIRSAVQASKEANAWAEAGWAVSCFESSPEIKREVRAWQAAADKARAT